MDETRAARTLTVLDVGGTRLRWSTWSRRDGLGPVAEKPTPGLTNLPGQDAAELRARLVAEMARIPPRGGHAGVSFGAALHQTTGVVYASAPLWGAEAGEFDLRSRLRALRPDVRWHIVNDVTAALLHLCADPVSRDCRKVLVATISTGVACRVMDRRTGDIPVDGCGLQGEIGHLPAAVPAAWIDTAPRCACGEDGHVAAYSSGPGLRALARIARRRDPRSWASSSLSATGIPFEAALRAAVSADDPLARDLLRAATKPIADVVRTALCLAPDLDLVAFTGGVARAFGEHYRSAVVDHLDEHGLYLTSALSREWLVNRIVVCPPGSAECLIGAGLAAESDM